MPLIDGHGLCLLIRNGQEPGITGALSEIPIVVIAMMTLPPQIGRTWKCFVDLNY